MLFFTPVTPTPKKRRVFYSFHYLRDAWRASQVRYIGTIEGSPPASDNDWEQVKRGGDKAIQSWIDNQMHGRSCLVVLVGEKTVDGRGLRKWIRYEIEKAWNDGKGVVGIQIHNLKDRSGKQDSAGPNPFDCVKLQDGTLLSSRVSLYGSRALDSQATYRYIANNIADWIEAAIANRRDYG